MLKQRFIVQFGSNILIKLVTMIAGIVVARIAGARVVGIIAFGTSYVSIWGFINTIFAAGHLKLVSEGRDHGNCITTYTYLKGGSIALYLFVVLCWFICQKYLFNYKFESSDQQVIIIILLFVTALTQARNIVSNSYTATLQQAKANLPGVIEKTLFNVGRIVVVALGFRAIGLASWNLMTVIIVLPMCYILFRQLPWGVWDHGLFEKYKYYGVPSIFINIINSILQYADKLILAHYTNVGELGYYSVAMAVGGSLMLISNSIGTIFFPLFSKLISENKWDQVNNKMHIYQEINTLFILPVTILLVIIARPFLITLLGPQYEQSVVPFMIIILSTYVVIVGVPYGNIIYGLGKFYVNVWLSVIKLITFFFSITFFVSPIFLDLGAIGVALNLLLINLLSNSMYFLISHKIGHLTFDRINNVRMVVIIVLSGAIYYLSRILSSHTSWWWVIIIPIYLVIVYAILFATKLIRIKNIQVLLDVLNIKKTYKYISDELRK